MKWLVLFLSLTSAGSFQVKAVLEKQKGLLFCQNCQSVYNSGSFVPVWENEYNEGQGEAIQADVVYGVPNDGRELYFNEHQIEHRLVLVDRGGGVPIVDKVYRAQKAGAAAVLVVDDGECSEDFECGILGSRRKHGFGYQDGWHKWKDVNIPSGLISKNSGSRIKSAMQLKKLSIDGIGVQYIHANVK